jgi:hypothetical protein
MTYHIKAITVSLSILVAACHPDPSATAAAGAATNAAAGGAVKIGAAVPREPGLPAQEALTRGVADFMRWKSWRFRGTSIFTISSMPELSNYGTFDTRLVVTPSGAVDGHMSVQASGGGSYEQYTRGGSGYLKTENGEWTKQPAGGGGGLVSLAARRVIAAFAELVEDVRYTDYTETEYVIACVMGAKYAAGAARLVGSGAHAHGPAKKTQVRVTLDRQSCRFTRIWMLDSQTNADVRGVIATETDGSYSEIDGPQAISPPAEALGAPAGN